MHETSCKGAQACVVLLSFPQTQIMEASASSQLLN